jgi:small subunit ribosomal protein S1
LSTSPVIAVNDIGSEADFLAAIEGTIRNFNDGDLVEGTVVQVDREEVLLDIGYKTEGVIPSRELSIRHDADPNDIVKVGDKVEALVLQKEDKEGRLILSKKRAQYERAWGEIEQLLKLLRVDSSLISVCVASCQHLWLKCVASAI